MSKASVAQEPSMDEILASIRRIIETGEDRGQGETVGSQAGTARAKPFDTIPGTTMPSVIASYAHDSNGPSPAVQGTGELERARLAAGYTPPETSYGSTSYDVSYASGSSETHDADDDHLTAQLETELAATWGEPHPHQNSAAVQFESDNAASVTDSDDGKSEEDTALSFVPRFHADADQEQADRPDRTMSEPVRQEPIDERGAFEPANTDRKLPEAPIGGYDAYEASANPLASVATGQMVAASFDELAQAIRNGELKSLEAMAQDMLKPMLSEWLDNNLPRMVERLVRDEIDRMSRGGSRR